MDAILHDGCVKNTVIEYIKVDRGHDTVLDVGLADKLHMIEQLGSPAEIKYERLDDGKYKLRVYQYSRCQYKSFIVYGMQSVFDHKHVYKDVIDKPEDPVAAEEEEVDPKTGKKKKPKGPVTEATILRRRKTFDETVRNRKKGSIDIGGNKGNVYERATSAVFTRGEVSSGNELEDEASRSAVLSTEDKGDSDLADAAELNDIDDVSADCERNLTGRMEINRDEDSLGQCHVDVNVVEDVERIPESTVELIPGNEVDGRNEVLTIRAED